MPRFTANLSMMFQEVKFLDRFQAAAKAGFKGVEYLFPYDFEVAQLVDLLRSNNLEQVLHNLPAGDWAAGERGIAILPDRVGEFQDGVGKAIEYAQALGNKQVNLLVGIAPKGVDHQTLTTTLIDNARFAAAELAKHGIGLLMEPVNTRDIPGFFLSGTQQCLDIIAATGHIQLADNPGRNEPGTGEINYPFLFRFLDRIGYQGWIGCEYIPATTTKRGLGWFEPYK